MENKKPSKQENEIEFKLDSTLTKGKLYIGTQQIISFYNLDRIIFNIDGERKILDPKQRII